MADVNRPSDSEFAEQLAALRELDAVDASLAALDPDDQSRAALTARRADVLRRIVAWDARFAHARGEPGRR